LGSGYLGPYGNTWIDTPSFNRLAAESLLFEFAMTDSTHLPTVYRSYWQAVHAMQRDAQGEYLAQALKQTTVHTALITDDPSVASLPGSELFDEKVAVEMPEAAEAAAEAGQTQLARLFAKVLHWLEQAPEPYLLWVHARAMDGPWDGPLELRNQYAEEDDPLPPQIVQPPVQKLARDCDPDQALGFTHAYAGQVSLLDDCLGAFLDAAGKLGLDGDTALILTSPRGYPLGEHGRVGAHDESLYCESVHVPYLVRYPGGTHAAQRSRGLMQPAQIRAAVLQWLGLSDSPTPFFDPDPVDGPVCDRACAIAGGYRSIRTPAWYLHRSPDAGCQLFAKPDDRWEVNEISDRCGDVVEELNRLLDEFEQAVQVGGGELSRLPAILVDGVE
jgi:hypothetical protein